ncbi:hypothetical protein Tsubulata_047607 [Turnera subulata]|uniref:Uncharacterized protein n=1 Tax=Turnera subulata TaxID=218843 RepID=A0A9Q0FR50_9ROSI|nr:hypothetical protein Tsubulata_047607 [Turnera subulata]
MILPRLHLWQKISRSTRPIVFIFVMVSLVSHPMVVVGFLMRRMVVSKVGQNPYHGYTNICGATGGIRPTLRSGEKLMFMVSSGEASGCYCGTQ